MYGAGLPMDGCVCVIRERRIREATIALFTCVAVPDLSLPTYSKSFKVLGDRSRLEITWNDPYLRQEEVFPDSRLAVRN